ncbi:hypothetical protein CEE44_05285 [Candidatus Woesearchaeota archaeon B3_Woes]|nr:MAG: hypothetical protein CEE44_05285 [Candidatus Woesearchaeota archaeon B3_Woes]
MKIKIRYNHWLPRLFKKNGITLYPYIFIRHSEPISFKKRITHHEWIHIIQIRKKGFFQFYFKWLIELLINILKYKNYNKAYKNISYEVEAYKNMFKIKIPKKLE